MIPKVMAMNWYKEHQYDAFRKLCDDGHNLPDTFGSFVKKAEQGIEKFKREGVVVVKVEMDIDEFSAWCPRNGYNLDAQGRTRFANYRLMEMIKSGEVKVPGIDPSALG